ncbi:DUF2281 domain-containing protein [Spirosoma montaniterrae]|uniref:DUF2281 domain-containing protein n=1 Tax=Spirosoma montaniterrae TaxID=1178516 RepID=A0A1P9WTL2_9BACT|nr:DUF2281 domain-containing protein [Spirosoma montaniterrae]AQG78688.1 hypothetical protein AWR27_04660 [Spirosoma montaniterrae]
MQTAELKLKVVKEITELPDEQFIKVYDALVEVLHAPIRTPKFGSAKGLIAFMAEDFYAPLDDFKAYMP